MCDHQVFLSRIGYIELDLATINFFKPSNIMFDKGGVIPIEKLNMKYTKGMWKMYEQSYNSLPPRIMETIMKEIESKDSIRIEEVFKWAKRQL